MNRIIRFALAAAVLMPLNARADSNAMKRFNDEYPARSSQLLTTYGRIKGTYKIRRESLVQPGATREEFGEFAFDHQFEKVTIRRAIPTKSDGPARFGELVYCLGSDSIFYVTRLSDSPTFQVEGLGTDPSDRAAYRTLFGQFVKAPLVLAQAMSRTGFHVTSAEYTGDGDEQRMKLTYEFGHPKPGVRVAVTLNPTASWSVDSSEYHPLLISGADSRTEIEYGEKLRDVPLPRRVIVRDNAEVATCEFLTWSEEPTPPREFTMEHYGLPNLVGPNRTGGVSPWYWSVAIPLLALASFLLLRLGRKRAIKPA